MKLATGSGRGDRDPFPDRKSSKRSGLVFRAYGLGIRFPEHLYVSAEWNPCKPVFSFSNGFGKNLWAKTDGELFNLDSKTLGHQKVPRLVDDDQDTHDQDKRQESFHLIPPGATWNRCRHLAIMIGIARNLFRSGIFLSKFLCFVTGSFP